MLRSLMHNGTLVSSGTGCVLQSVKNGGGSFIGNLIPSKIETVTKNNLTFTNDGEVITVNGTASAATYYTLIGSSSSVPSNITPGEMYYLLISLTGENVRVRVGAKVSGTYSYIYDNARSTYIVVPESATGFDIALYIYTGGVVNNAKIKVEFLPELSNKDISKILMPTNPGAMMTIIDDDGAKGFYTDLLPLIQSKGVSISSAIIGRNIGVASSYMTWAEVEEAHENGAEILNHTYMHYGETDETRTVEEIVLDYEKNAVLMAKHGIVDTGDIVVYPGGSGNMPTVQEAAKRFARVGIRSNGNVLNYINQIDPVYIDRYRIESDYSYDLDSMKNLIDNCITKGGWMIWMIHTSNTSRWSSTALSSISQSIDYAKEQGLPIVSAKTGAKLYVPYIV